MEDNSADVVEKQILDLQRAIEALESQRSDLGDSVVETALVPLKEKLDLLRYQQEEQRKRVTILFADLVDSTAIAEKMDPEEVRELQQEYFSRWREIVRQHHGVLEKFIGDAA